MLAEVLDVLGVCQVLFPRVFVMVFLPVVDFVFVLVVTVVSGAEAEVGKCEAFGNTYSVLCIGDGAAAVRVEEIEDLVHGVFLLLCADVPRGLVLEAVCLEDVVARPLVAAVIVMKVEERAGVERADVMLLWNVSSDSFLPQY